MPFHHKYLAKKSYHPLNTSNQAAVAEAEAREASLNRRVEERKLKLQKERQQQTDQALLDKGNAIGVSGKATSVAFLYEPPPGFIPVTRTEADEQQQQQQSVKDEAREVNDLTKQEFPSRRGGAVSSSSSVGPASAASLSSLPLHAPPPPSTSPVESYAERRARHRTMTPQQIREELHPALKGAPVKGEHVRSMGFTAKPLGVILRDTRCIRCGGIGHASSDRECPKFNERAAADEFTRQREDPLTKLRATGVMETNVAGGKNGQFKLVYNDESYTVGGLAQDDPLQQAILVSDDEDGINNGASSPASGASSHHDRKRVKYSSSSSSSSLRLASQSFASSSLDAHEQAFLAGLSEEDMKILLKQLKKARETSSSSESESESESDTDDEDEKRERHRNSKKHSKSKGSSKKKKKKKKDHKSDKSRSKARKKSKDRKRKRRSSSPSSSSSDSDLSSRDFDHPSLTTHDASYRSLPSSAVMPINQTQPIMQPIPSSSSASSSVPSSTLEFDEELPPLE